ncbi:GNAT family N-acetyltransferase [Virgibacillus dokdonensis]|uniref:Putative acyltransferase n=1 Tax=Virgibacillus dokdonensis TaxID=302167 RepID=A0A2K9J4M8_9BACI|nr:GNAT family N-acetyltransferase [Virgibacillus dokdonensis]AUJ23940.1 putative acyltransferase [Virgibacillus dokdonensis]
MEKKSFQELDQLELYTLLKSRVDVFVVEQQCPYQEIDAYDLKATHLWLQDNQNLVVYARILPAGSKYVEASIGRVLVTKAYRDRGYGKELMEEAIKYTVNHFKDSIKIQAQQHLKAFYQAFGFKQVSTAYLDDRIWHIDMIWEQK